MPRSMPMARRWTSSIFSKGQFDQFSEEARFNYEGKAVKAVAGVFYGWDKTIVDNGFDIGSAIAPGVDGGFFQHFRQVRRTYAVFGQTDVNLTPKLVATIGLRYSADRSAYDDGYAYLFMGSFGGTRTPLFTTVPCTTGVGTCPMMPTHAMASRDATTRSPAVPR
jgi:outer membrane receptor protein involved in Fe transport